MEDDDEEEDEDMEEDDDEDSDDEVTTTEIFALQEEGAMRCCISMHKHFQRRNGPRRQ